MQSTKTTHLYNFQHYIVQIIQHGPQKLSITIVDPHNSAQFCYSQYSLCKIACSTLIKVLTQTSSQLSLKIEPFYQSSTNSQQKKQYLRLLIRVCSKFLIDITQQIVIPKSKDLKQQDIILSRLDSLSKQTKQLTENKQIAQVYCNKNYIDEMNYNSSSSYEDIGSIYLKKGRYLVTLSFMAKVGQGGMYLYIGNGKQILPNGGFYVAISETFVPILINKLFNVNQQQQNIMFTTYYASACPITLKNTVISAQRI